MLRRLPRPDRRRTAAALGAATMLAMLVTPSPADAAPASSACRTQNVDTSARQARAVFTGTVTAVSEAAGEAPVVAVYTQSVEVERVYNGPVRDEVVTVQTERIRRQCSLGRLAEGTSYVFFVDGDGDTAWTAAGDSGSALRSEDLVAQVEAIYGSGRSPVAPTQEAVAFTEADTSAPPRFARLAAPGAALVIVGLLGLLVAGRLGRRKAS